MKRSKSEYRPTLLDRRGPDAGVTLRAFGYGGTVCVLALVGTWIVAANRGLDLSSFVVVLGLLGIALGAGALATGLTVLLSNTAGSAYRSLMVTGATTPYKEQYSYQQTLVMQGRLDEALASFEAVIAEQPHAIDPRVKAAELYARSKGNPTRAAALFREIRLIPTATSGDDIYVTNRLVDLLNGPLNDPGRALVELRRLIEKYPGTAAADHARNAIASLKPTHVPAS